MGHGKHRSERIKKQLYNHYWDSRGARHEMTLAKGGRRAAPLGEGVTFCCQIKSNSWLEAKTQLDAHVAELQRQALAGHR